LAAALDAAERRWPGLSRAQLVVRLAVEGHRAAVAERDRRRQRRLAALRDHSGAFTGTYRAGDRERLRAEWPE
jgi:hypothetical protein